MKKIIFLSALNLTLGLLASADLLFETNDVHLKPEIGVEKVEAVYSFVNAGENPVTITETKSSCGCTIAAIDKNVYQPGEKGEIKATFTIGQRRGTQHKTITVSTNEEPKSQYHLNLNVEIPVTIMIEPNLLQWAKNEAPEPKSAEIKTGDATKFKIVGMSDAPETYHLKMDMHEDGTATIEAVPVGEIVRRVERITITVEGDEGKTYTDTLYLLRR